MIPAFRREVVETVMSWLNGIQPDANPWASWDGNVLVVVEHVSKYGDDEEKRTLPDADGRYTLGGLWWPWTTEPSTEAPPAVPAPASQSDAEAEGYIPFFDVPERFTRSHCRDCRISRTVHGRPSHPRTPRTRPRRRYEHRQGPFVPCCSAAAACPSVNQRGRSNRKPAPPPCPLRCVPGTRVRPGQPARLSPFHDERNLVIYSGHAGEVILARHPDFGFVIDGDVQPGTVDVLLQHGFRRDDNDVLALPPDMPEAEAQDTLRRAAQMLAATGHTVTELSDQQAIEYARWATVVATLTCSRDRLLDRIRSIHPTPDCLPVPVLRIPSSLEEFDQAIDEVYANLFAPDGANGRRWRALQDTCTHLPVHTVIAIHPVIHRWYHLLVSARQHILDSHAHALAPTAEKLDLELLLLLPFPRDHIVHATTVDQLRDGQEFSLDEGKTWHVCAVVMFGTVSVYTGENDTDGDPQCVRIEAERDQSCWVRIPSEA